MNNALQTRQWMFALALPLTTALYIGAEGLDPKGTDRIVMTTAIAVRVPPIAANHSTQLYTSGSLSELALAGVAISYGAIAMMVRKLGSTAATIAVLMGGIGAFFGAIVNVFVGINLAAAATAAVTRCGGTVPDRELQFGTRSGVHGCLRLQRVPRCDHHGSRVVAKPSCAALARGLIRGGF